MRNWIAPLIFGLAGAAVLVSLGVWQLQRLGWKEGILADIDSRIAADPVALPKALDPIRDKYLPVKISGQYGDRTIRVMSSKKRVGPGFRLLTSFETTAGDVIIVDRGFLRADGILPDPHSGEVTIIGNLHWPDEVDGFTPEPETEEGLWFARDVTSIADYLGVNPVLVVARQLSYDPQGVTPLPVTTDGIANDHLEYAITWFSLALIWLSMTGYFIWRLIRPRKA